MAPSVKHVQEAQNVHAGVMVIVRYALVSLIESIAHRLQCCFNNNTKNNSIVGACIYQ